MLAVRSRNGIGHTAPGVGGQRFGFGIRRLDRFLAKRGLAVYVDDLGASRACRSDRLEKVERSYVIGVRVPPLRHGVGRWDGGAVDCLDR